MNDLNQCKTILAELDYYKKYLISKSFINLDISDIKEAFQRFLIYR